MKINIRKLEELIQEKFNGNKTKFAENIGISREYVSKILNDKSENNSAKFCNALILYCENNKLDYKDYIFLK